MRTVTLLDGRQVPSDSEEHRHECEARGLARLPLDQRRHELELIEARRGKAAADRLRETLTAMWESRGPQR